jgi:dolichol kinase
MARRIIAAIQQRYSTFLPEQYGAEVVRKAIHLLVALVPLLASISVNLTVGILAGGTLFYIFAERSRREGRTIIFVSDLTLIASRHSDTRRFVLGPVTLGLGAMLALLLYPATASTIAVYALAFGDSAASLVGKAVGGLPIPFSKRKTVAGTFACFLAVFAITYRITRNLLISSFIALAAALLEALPTSDLDNILVPVGTGFVASQLLPLL